MYHIRVFLSVSIFLVLALGCAHTGGQRGKKSFDPMISGASQVAEKRKIVVSGVDLQNTDFDIPIQVNSRVEFWIDYFTGRGRKAFTKYLERSEHFIPYIIPILEKNGLPRDLVFVAMIESGFHNHAKSRARAVGPWQFISATGKRYGLKINYWVDERRDIKKSTLAAGKYLKDLYEMFGSWELAAAGYNAGENKVSRAIRRYRTKDFWAIARQRFLRPETRNYVPKMMAAAIITKNRTQFGFEEKYSKPESGQAVASDGSVVRIEANDEKSRALDLVDKEHLFSIIGEYDSEVTDAPSGTVPAALVVPASSDFSISRGHLDDEDVYSFNEESVAKSVPTPNVSRKGEVFGESIVEIELQGPADLFKVGRAAGLSYQTVKNLNPEILRWCTPPGEEAFKIKIPASSKNRFLTIYNHPSFPRALRFRTYKVRRGDTLGRIARRFRIRVQAIKDLNGIRSSRQLVAGKKIYLPIPSDKSRSLVQLDVFENHPSRSVSRETKFTPVSFEARKQARTSLKSGI